MTNALRQKEKLRLEAEIILSDRLHPSDAALHLLRHGVHIAKATLEWIALEDCRRPGLHIDHVNRVARLVYLMCASGADLHAQRKAHLALHLTLLPGLVQQAD